MKTATITFTLFILTFFISCYNDKKQSLDNSTFNKITQENADTINSIDTLEIGLQRVDNKIQFNPFPVYDTLYNYSKMNDTLIYSVGYLDINLNFTENKTPNIYFAKREITVESGKLKEVHIIDTNMGVEIILNYGEHGFINFLNKKIQATNAPHFKLK